MKAPFDPSSDRKGEEWTLESGILEVVFPGQKFEQTKSDLDFEGVDIISLDKLIGVYDRSRFPNPNGSHYYDMTFNVWEGKQEYYKSLRKLKHNCEYYDSFVATITKTLGDPKLRWKDPTAHATERCVVDLKRMMLDIRTAGSFSKFGFDDSQVKNGFIILPEYIWRRYVLRCERYID